jgi:hypothetical protein
VPHPGDVRFRSKARGNPLIGGDKSGRWESWYEEMVPIADALFDEHLRVIAKEGAQE